MNLNNLLAGLIIGAMLFWNVHPSDILRIKLRVAVVILYLLIFTYTVFFE